MATTKIRVLGQAYPNANVETALYTCGNTGGAVISSFIVCNTGAAMDFVTARMCIGGAADSNKQFIYSNVALAPNYVVDLTAGMTMANTDVLKVTSVFGTTAFNLFGQETN